MISCSPSETERAGKEMTLALASGSIVLLYGELGAGKTTFVRGLCSAFSADFPISPSFVLLNIYPSPSLSIYHIDLYRLANEEEFAERGLYEYLPSSGITVVEWAQRFPQLWQKLPNCLSVSIEITSDKCRKITRN